MRVDQHYESVREYRLWFRCSVRYVLLNLFGWLLRWEESGRSAALLWGAISKIYSKLYAASLCSSHLDFLQGCRLSASGLIPNCSIGGPEGPFCWVLFSLQHNFSNSHWTSCALSYIIVRRPLNLFPWMSNGICNFRRLWNGMFWSSLSGNNCHAVHRSPSSSATVFQLSSPTPTEYTTSAVFGMACLAGSEVNTQHLYSNKTARTHLRIKLRTNYWLTNHIWLTLWLCANKWLMLN